jgi:glucosylceramidase
VAFKTPNGKKVLILENDGNSNENCTIVFNNKSFSALIEAGAVATFLWN